MLEVNSIYLYRNRKQVFKNFSLNLKNSEIILLEGENGVGKTSLLDTISGLINLKTGSIKINGKEINEIGEFRKNYFSYIPHKNCLKENLSINENLLSWLKLLNIEINNQDYQTKLKVFNLTNLQNKLINKLSHGQKKKVALTKLLFSNTKLWLLDEPFNGIDQKSSKSLKKIMIEHTQKNGCILFSSHIEPDIKFTKKVILKKTINKLQTKTFDNWEVL